MGDGQKHAPCMHASLVAGNSTSPCMHATLTSDSSDSNVGAMPKSQQDDKNFSIIILNAV